MIVIEFVNLMSSFIDNFKHKAPDIFYHFNSDNVH